MEVPDPYREDGQLNSLKTEGESFFNCKKKNKTQLTGY